MLASRWWFDEAQEAINFVARLLGFGVAAPRTLEHSSDVAKVSAVIASFGFTDSPLVEGLGPDNVAWIDEGIAKGDEHVRRGHRIHQVLLDVLPHVKL